MFFPCWMRHRGRTMRENQSRSGYSLIELLVVLVIVGILSVVGLATFGDRRGSAVKALIGQVDGVIMQAQKVTVSTGRDVMLSVNGTWTATGVPSLTGSGPLIIDGRPFDPVTAVPTFASPRIGSPSDVFVSLFQTKNKDHSMAGVATGADGNSAADSIRAVPPFSTDASFRKALDNKLCMGGHKDVLVSGSTNRYLTGFSVVIVSINSSTGDVITSGPVGVLVVPENSATVYRFYRAEGGTEWRRI